MNIASISFQSALLETSNKMYIIQETQTLTCWQLLNYYSPFNS